MFRIHKARLGTKYIILKSAVHKGAMTTEFLRREYELGSTLSHSCIVTTLGFEEDTPAGPALVLEYIEGVSLEEYIATHPTESATDRIIDDILDGTDYLHHRGVLHNDIKPSNIIVNPHGAARIIDFGLSISDSFQFVCCFDKTAGEGLEKFAYNFKSITNDGWHHIAVTSASLGENTSDVILKLYVDGQLTESLEEVPWESCGYREMTIGGNKNGAYSSAITAKFDNIGFYKITLTDSDILAIFNDRL